MNKRIVLEHSSGLRQICGILDIADDTDLERQLLCNWMAYNLVSANKRHVVYREVEDPMAASLASGQTTSTASTEVTS